MQILLIENGRTIAPCLVKGLTESGHVVDRADDGHRALQVPQEHRYDAMIVDLGLPTCEGLRIVAALRASDDHTPVLIVSAVGSQDDRTRALKAGADDYLVEPYALTELLARLDALARPFPRGQCETHLQVEDLELNAVTQQVSRDGQVIRLPRSEFRLLRYLMCHKGHLLTRRMLFEQIWNYHFDLQDTVIDVHIRRLQAKIDSNCRKPLLHRIRGGGYCMGRLAQREHKRPPIRRC